jgi:hypothetical protein
MLFLPPSKCAAPFVSGFLQVDFGNLFSLYILLHSGVFKMGLRTQMKEEIALIGSEEVILQSHLSFCRLIEALTRYRRKTKS